MRNARSSERLRHATNSVEKTRKGHQITTPQMGATSEWAIPQPAALTITAAHEQGLDRRGEGDERDDCSRSLDLELGLRGLRE